MDGPITKRIHISGLTPNITSSDIETRLSTFGTVKAVDGVGLLDGVGQPRKFAYVTLESTTGKLARCMNVLSGTTWKGAKLRLGEAKPDFRQRIQAEIAAPVELRPSKRPRRVGVYSSDMSPVTLSTTRAGWKKTSQGRLLHTVRMRPDRPLPPTLEDLSALKKVAGKLSALKGKTKEKEKRSRKLKLKSPPTRARKRTIDVIKWGSTQLKGIFLESQVPVPASLGLGPAGVFDEDDGTDASSEAEEEREEEREVAEQLEKSVSPVGPPPAAITLLPTATPAPAQATSTPSPPPPPSYSTVTSTSQTIDLTSEKNHSLSILASLFSSKSTRRGGSVSNRDEEDSEDDWSGKESLGSNVEELIKRERERDRNLTSNVKGEIHSGQKRGIETVEAEEADGFEVVPRERVKSRSAKSFAEDGDEEMAEAVEKQGGDGIASEHQESESSEMDVDAGPGSKGGSSRGPVEGDDAESEDDGGDDSGGDQGGEDQHRNDGEKAGEGSGSDDGEHSASEDSDESDSDEEEKSDEDKPQLKNSTRLQDLFAPRKEEAGFSLLGHLDLDLELDDEAPFSIEPSTGTTGSSLSHFDIPGIQTSSQARWGASSTPTVTTTSTTFLNPTTPLFFPTEATFAGGSAMRARQKDVISCLVEKLQLEVVAANQRGGHDGGYSGGARDGMGRGRGYSFPAMGMQHATSPRNDNQNAGNSQSPSTSYLSKLDFYKTQTEDEIRREWEEGRVEVTRGWKKRAREAGKGARKSSRLGAGVEE